jgi:threonine dehydratase
MSVTYDDILAARRLLSGHIVDTPFNAVDTLSEVAGVKLSIKFENLQFTGSFKDRGALVKLTSLDAAARQAGVIAMSAGNHAQGVAYRARDLGIRATIVMPEGTPFIKVNSTQVLGANVFLHGKNIEEAAAFADQHATAHGLAFVHPYDDDKVIAGQGTIGLEMLEADPDLDVLVLPIGGGGLISGISIAAKKLKPSIQIYGVQAARVPSMHAAIKGGSAPQSSRTIADGIAVKAPGTRTQPVIEALVEDILLVDETALERAILLLLEIEKTVVEGAGAAALAAVLQHQELFAGKRIGLVVTGGNIDPRVLSSIILSGLVGAGRIVRLRVEVPDRPGMLAGITQIIGAARANILEVFHQRAFSGLSVTATSITLVLETRNDAHVAEVIGKLEAADHTVAAIPSGDMSWVG